MISAEELRIGNLVKTAGVSLAKEAFSFEGTIQSISEDTDRCIKVQGKKRFMFVGLEDIHGIPLTEDWLPRIGFEEEYRGEWTIRYTHTKYHEIGYDWNGPYGWRFRYYGHHIDCAYVHNLQNLFYALKGEELTYKNLTDVGI